MLEFHFIESGLLSEFQPFFWYLFLEKFFATHTFGSDSLLCRFLLLLLLLFFCNS